MVQGLDDTTAGGNRRRLDNLDVQRASKVGANAARRLAEYIVSNKLAAGTVLPTEREIADSFGIGRGTTREALRILEVFGLVRMRQGRYGGPVVRYPDAGDLSASLTLAFYARGASMLNVLEARRVVEPVLVRLAATRISDEQIDELRATIAALRIPNVSEDAYLRQSERFHNVVSEAGGSPVLSVVAAGLHRIGGGEIVGIRYGPREVAATAAAHEKVVEALAGHDEDQAVVAWEAHLFDAGRYWKRYYEEAASEPVTWTV
jgi:GntR family transcriptional regulator, transcriptional repressor for pyruvate dehydrogenase complex